jgi:protease-4
MIHRILTKVFETPWVIRPETHSAIQKVISSKIQRGQIQDTEDDGDPLNQDEPLEYVPNAASISIIPVFGILGKHLSGLETACGGYDVDALAAQLKTARDNPKVASIVIWFNSPGGTVTGIPETSALIAEIDAIKPVYAFTDGQMCSGAYWLASQCRSIIATESADIGSVGVYLALLDETRAMEIEGVKVNAIYKGDFKLAGASFKPLTDSERAMFQEGVDRIYQKFTSAVTSKRTIDSQFLQGQVFDGEQAVTNNFADGLVNNVDEFLALIQGKLTTN